MAPRPVEVPLVTKPVVPIVERVERPVLKPVLERPVPVASRPILTAPEVVEVREPIKIVAPPVQPVRLAP